MNDTGATVLLIFLFAFIIAAISTGITADSINNRWELHIECLRTVEMNDYCDSAFRAPTGK